MGEVSSGIYSKRFEYFDNDGLPQAIMLKPLNPSYLPKLFKVANAFKGVKKVSGESDEDYSSRMLSVLTEEVVKDLSDMCLATIKKSVKDLKDEDAEGFVTSQFMTLFPAVIELNLNSGKEK